MQTIASQKNFPTCNLLRAAISTGTPGGIIYMYLELWFKEGTLKPSSPGVFGSNK